MSLGRDRLRDRDEEEDDGDGGSTVGSTVVATVELPHLRKPLPFNQSEYGSLIAGRARPRSRPPRSTISGMVCRPDINMRVSVGACLSGLRTVNAVLISRWSFK